MQIDLDKITESTASRATARLASILIVPIIGLVGWFALDMLSGIKENQKLFWQQVGSMNTKFGDIKDTLGKIDTNLSVANTSYQAHVKDDDRFENSIEKQLTDHDVRLRLMEQRPALLSPITPVAPTAPAPRPPP